jgi:hypothetical protein
LRNVMAGILAFDGMLDADALTDAFTALSRRHEALRTVIVDVDGTPRQRVMPAAPFDMPRFDLSACAEEAQAVEVERLALERAYARSTWHDAAARCLQLAPERWLLRSRCIIASSGWSNGLLRDGSACCTARHALAGQARPRSRCRMRLALRRLRGMAARAGGGALAGASGLLGAPRRRTPGARIASGSAEAAPSTPRGVVIGAVAEMAARCAIRGRARRDAVHAAACRVY